MYLVLGTVLECGFHYAQAKNPKAILWPFSSITPGHADTYLQLSELRPSLLPHPRVGLERRFGALSSLIKRLSSHPVI